MTTSTDQPAVVPAFQGVGTTRRIKNAVATTLIVLAFVLALMPLVLLLITVVSKGYRALGSADWWSHSLRGVLPGDFTGGAYHAIFGTLVQGLVCALITVPLGVLAAWRQGSLIDRAVMALAVLGFSVPVFVVGYLLAYVFALKLGWLPVQGFAPISRGLWPFLRTLILPSVALGLIYIALIARITRATMLEVLNQDYVRTARAKGLAQRLVILRHALRNALLPIVTVVGLQIGGLLGGAILTETIFAWPGMGLWMYQAILQRDYPIVQAGVLVAACIFVLVNLLVDCSYSLLDPRISRS